MIALDAATGRELWVFDPEIRRDITYGDFASRGVSLWIDEASAPDDECHRTIFVATAQSQLIAIDARDGRPCASFGSNGMVDLTKGLRIAPFESNQKYPIAQREIDTQEVASIANLEPGERASRLHSEQQSHRGPRTRSRVGTSLVDVLVPSHGVPYFGGARHSCSRSDNTQIHSATPETG